MHISGVFWGKLLYLWHSRWCGAASSSNTAFISFRWSYAVHAKYCVGKSSACRHHAYRLTMLKELSAAMFEVWCGESCAKSSIKTLNSRRSCSSLTAFGPTRILHSFLHSTPTANNHWWLGWPPQESLHSQNLPSWEHSQVCGRILSALHVCCRCVASPKLLA